MDYIDLDLEYQFLAPSPLYTPQAQSLVKAEPLRSNVFDEMPNLNLEGPKKKEEKKPEVVAEADNKKKVELAYPPGPRVVYKYFKEAEMYQGPTRVVVLPPVNDQPDRGIKRHDQWMSYLFAASPTVFNLTRRAVSAPPLENLLSHLRDQASKKNGKPYTCTVPATPSPVPTSLTAASLTLHSWMHALIDASFTLQQAASDFLLLSLLRKEVSLGVYTTPPQIILQLKRRASVFTNSRETQAANAIVQKMDLLWRRWNAHGMQRPWNECHQYIEGTSCQRENTVMTKMGNEKVLSSRYYCGAGNILDIENMEPTEDDGRMTINQAVVIQLKSVESYPGFLVKAPLDQLAADKVYNICFLTLTSGIDISSSTSRTVFVRNWAAPFIDLPERFAAPSIKRAETPQPDPHATPTSRPAEAPVERKASRRETSQVAEPPASSTPRKRSETPSSTKPAKRPKTGSGLVLGDVIHTDQTRRYFNKLKKPVTEEDALLVGQDVVHLDTRITTPQSAISKGKDLGRVAAVYDNGPGTDPVVVLKMYTRDVRGDLGEWEVVETDNVKELPPDKLVLAKVDVRSTADVQLRPCGPVGELGDWKLAKWEGQEWPGGTRIDREMCRFEMRLLCWRRVTKGGKSTEPIPGAQPPMQPVREEPKQPPPPQTEPQPPRQATRSVNFRRTPPPKAEPKTEPAPPASTLDISAIIAQSNLQPPQHKEIPLPQPPPRDTPPPQPKTRVLSFKRRTPPPPPPPSSA